MLVDILLAVSAVVVGLGLVVWQISRPTVCPWCMNPGRHARRCPLGDMTPEERQAWNQGHR